MSQYYFKLTLFNEAKQLMEKFNGVNPLEKICMELIEAEQAKGYHVVEFYARKLTPNADKLKLRK